MDSFSWDDIEPLPISDEGIQVGQILYTNEFRTTMGYLRALMDKREYSERALATTEAALELNAANYSAWEYRYHNIINLGKDLLEELDWSETVALDNLKNYQIWNYRQLLITKIGNLNFNVKREFPLIQIMLDEDSKNYHVWSYRKWLIQFNDYYDDELDFVEKMINSDVYNNSAWVHRYFTVAHQKHSETIFKDEIDYTMAKVRLAPQNVSSWNYLIGIHELFGKDISHLETFVSSFATVLFDENSEGNSSTSSNVSIPALELLTKLYVCSNPQLAEKGYELLATKYDTIRKNYWEFQKKLITTK